MLGALGMLLVLCTGITSNAAQRERWSHDGFIVTEGSEKLNDALKRAVAEQIEIVNSVGLDRDFIVFFQSVPMMVEASIGPVRGTPGLYIKGDRAVKLTSGIGSIGHKPVLLHELLHAYHDQKLKDGFRNAQVVKLYQDAKAKKLFSLSSHMMANPAEFFACSGTTYLFGVTAQEPFRREQLKQQLKLLQFLGKVFGPACGSYEGTLTGDSPPQKE